MNRFWSPLIKTLDPYIPGEQLNIDNIIKLNTNENPYGPSQKVIEAISCRLNEKLRLYPHPESEGIKVSAAKWLKRDKDEIFAGNGSDEVLAHLFKGFFTDKKSPLFFPDISYSFYPVYCGLYNIDYQTIPLNSNFEIDIENYKKVDGDIIFPNPNAPTGIYLPLEKVEELLRSNSERLVVIDEAYIDFGGQSAVSLIDNYDNLIVIRTLSKSFSLAGLRVGFAVAQKDLIEGLTRIKNCFNSYPLDNLAIAGGAAALNDTEYLQKSVQKIIDARRVLTDSLKTLGFNVLDSKANFVFAEHKNIPAGEIAAELKKRNILVRHFKGNRIDNFLRITVGTQKQVELLIAAIKEIVDK
ncbi:MAG: histidinol-phosphate transaminase [Deltaproteobacteria bacterium]|nr:histidinol-phosphate transaminase [Deltaproteobacteria bacterium]